MTNNGHDKFIEYIDKARSVLSADFDVGNGVVEFLYAPPEFHVEIFVSVNNDDVLTCYDLAKLMTNDDVRSWIVKNRPDTSHGDTIKAEVDWFILLLRRLKTEPEFSSLV